MNLVLAMKADQSVVARTVPAEVIQKLNAVAAARAVAAVSRAGRRVSRVARTNAAGVRTGYRLVRHGNRHGATLLGQRAFSNQVRGVGQHTQARMLFNAIGNRADRIAARGGTPGLVAGVAGGVAAARGQRAASRAITRLRAGGGRNLRHRDTIDRFREGGAGRGFVHGHYRRENGRRVWVAGYYSR